jgi:PAS domain S-box-containing protein
MESTFELLNGVEALFEHMPRSLFFVKDREGRYLAANEELVRLFGAANEAEVIGCTDADFLPAYIAEGYRKDDRLLFDNGVTIRNRVELVTRGGVVDWIITTKVPMRNTAGEIVAVAGHAREYLGEGSASTMPEELRLPIAYIRENYADTILVVDLATASGRSVSSLERAFRRHLHVTPKDYIRKVRVHEACKQLIHSQDPVAGIAFECGFSDQAHLTREFKRIMHTTPAAYRKSHSCE